MFAKVYDVSPGGLSRIQNGGLHRYVLFVLAGSAALLLWSIGRV